METLLIKISTRLTHQYKLLIISKLIKFRKISLNFSNKIELSKSLPACNSVMSSLYI
jgi:hypothetical protein